MTFRSGYTCLGARQAGVIHFEKDLSSTGDKHHLVFILTLASAVWQLF